MDYLVNGPRDRPKLLVTLSETNYLNAEFFSEFSSHLCNRIVTSLNSRKLKKNGDRVRREEQKKNRNI